LNHFLHTSEGDETVVEVHPVVMFSILDHYMRRNEGQDRVIGTLLGYKDGNKVYVSDCYAVPHYVQEGGGNALIGSEYSREMFQLQQIASIDKREKIIGWYATTPDGECISTSTVIFHEFYGQSSSIANPLHMVVDTSLVNNRLITKCFVSKRVQIKSKPIPFAQFQQLQMKVIAPLAERSALDFMMKGTENWAQNAVQKVAQGALEEQTTTDDANPDESQKEKDEESKKKTLNLKFDDHAVPSEVAGLELSMKKLQGLLKDVGAYVEDVRNGKIPKDEEMGLRIANALSIVSRIDANSFDKLFNNSLQDLLMVAYLSNLARAQLAITERIRRPQPM